MLLGYNTNGFAHHRLEDAVEILVEVGYRAVGLTIDHHLLNPYADDLQKQIQDVRRLLRRHEMRSVIETGARFLLDARQKHEPTLMTADPAGRARRLLLYEHAINIAAELESDCVSLWSGVLRDAGMSEDQAFDRLVSGLEQIIRYAERRGVVIGFEPEPGMFIDTLARFEKLLTRLDSPALRLTIDIGHLHCQGELPIADQLRRWRDRLVNIHIEDMRAGVHEHLMFGEGEIDFPPVLQAIREINYSGGVYVELSRHSHVAADAARSAYEYLASGLPKSQ